MSMVENNGSSNHNLGLANQQSQKDTAEADDCADQSVSVKSFPGATADEMVDFLKPTLRRKPDKLAIHAGTNDVSSSTPKVIADKVSKII